MTFLKQKIDFLPSTRDSKCLSSSASFFTASSETLGAFEKQTSTILMLSRLPYITEREEEKKRKKKDVSMNFYLNPIFSSLAIKSDQINTVINFNWTYLIF